MSVGLTIQFIGPVQAVQNHKILKYLRKNSMVTSHVFIWVMECWAKRSVVKLIEFRQIIIFKRNVLNMLKVDGLMCGFFEFGNGESSMNEGTFVGRGKAQWNEAIQQGLSAGVKTGFLIFINLYLSKSSWFIKYHTFINILYTYKCSMQTIQRVPIYKPKIFLRTVHLF